MVFDCFGQQVPDRNNGYGCVVLDHREMTNAVQVHQLQTVCKRLRKIDFDDISDHDVRYRCKFWRLPGKHKPAHAITFGKNACNRSMLRNYDNPDVLSAMRRIAVSALSLGLTVHRDFDFAARIRFSGR